MSSRAATPRVLVLIGVGALHAGVLLFLIANTRTQLAHIAAEAEPILVMLIEPRERRRPATTLQARPRARQSAAPVASKPDFPPTAGPIAPATAIDWHAAAADAAAREVEDDAQGRRRARAFASATDPMFAMRPSQAGLPWDEAHIHPVVPLGGLTTFIHLGDRCGVVLFLVVPFMGGCTLHKPPARGDLFEHMDDPVAPPEHEH
jgi:hypothetical protein